jgi:hypothetical protein
VTVLRGKTRKISVRMVDILANIQTTHLPNQIQDIRIPAGDNLLTINKGFFITVEEYVR